MNTDDLMNYAEGIIADLHDGPRDNIQLLMVAQVDALLAIANELKRANDMQGRQYEREDHLADMNFTRDLYSQ